MARTETSQANSLWTLDSGYVRPDQVTLTVTIEIRNSETGDLLETQVYSACFAGYEVEDAELLAVECLKVKLQHAYGPSEFRVPGSREAEVLANIFRSYWADDCGHFAYERDQIVEQLHGTFCKG